MGCVDNGRAPHHAGEWRAVGPVRRRRAPHPVLLVAGVVAIVVGVVLRFWAPTALWLDEALSVNIARLPALARSRRL